MAVRHDSSSAGSHGWLLLAGAVALVVAGVAFLVLGRISEAALVILAAVCLGLMDLASRRLADDHRA